MSGGKVEGTGGAAQLLGLNPSTLRNKNEKIEDSLWEKKSQGSKGRQKFLAYPLSRACARSSIRSSGCSMPTDSRKRESEILIRFLSVADILTWEVTAGAQMVDSTPPQAHRRGDQLQAPKE